ncbi:MAG: competence/damage-inducible protein A [Verrucomicrobiales bacterium]|nr:competence/damage-inducible protein A [Verrucomicrobiales bacterium]
MTVELINIGTELLLGTIANTHQQWLCSRLAELGMPVARQVSVPDSPELIRQAVAEALARADVIITTGGLGPTSDDVTVEHVAGLLGRQLREDPALVEHIEAFYAARARRVPAAAKRQARVPEGALVLPNPNGTAPGLVIELKPNPFRRDGKPGWLILLPGPGRELKPMFEQQVSPLLKEKFGAGQDYVSRTLRTVGLGESLVQEKITVPLGELVSAGLEVGFVAVPWGVDLRLACRGPGATELVQRAAEIARGVLGTAVYGEGADELEAVVVRLLTEGRKTLAIAESCTGGCIANRITNVPGASAVFLAGFVTYSNASKQSLLGVESAALAAHGAVSELVARQMAEGARRVTGADYALSVTGIAGPSGGTAQKPVGTVYIGLAAAAGVQVQKHHNLYDRISFKQVTAQQALNLLRLALVGGV